MTLTETIIDIADRHTTLAYLGMVPAKGPLPFGTSEGYVQLHRRLASPARTAYGDVAPGKSPTVLGRLSPGYTKHRYWHRYLGTSAYLGYPEQAWEALLPIEATLTRRIALLPGPVALAASPIPRLLLYPFGWSTWLSLRILGDHTIADLAAFLEHLFSGDALRFEDAPGALTVRTFFQDVARGARVDAFSGDETRDVDTQDVAIVVTVLAKHGGSPALGALGSEDQAALRRIVRPYGPPPSGSFDQHVYRVQPTSELEYLVHDSHGRFQWVEHMLSPGGSNYRHLRCYHNNTFTSLVQAWHLNGVIDAVVRQDPLTGTAFQVARAAAHVLESPPYKCASLVEFLNDPNVKASVQKATALKLPVDKPRKRKRKRSRQ